MRLPHWHRAGAEGNESHGPPSAGRMRDDDRRGDDPRGSRCRRRREQSGPARRPGWRRSDTCPRRRNRLEMAELSRSASGERALAARVQPPQALSPGRLPQRARLRLRLIRRVWIDQAVRRSRCDRGHARRGQRLVHGLVERRRARQPLVGELRAGDRDPNHPGPLPDPARSVAITPSSAYRWADSAPPTWAGVFPASSGRWPRFRVSWIPSGMPQSFSLRWRSSRTLRRTATTTLIPSMAPRTASTPPGTTRPSSLRNLEHTRVFESTGTGVPSKADPDPGQVRHRRGANDHLPDERELPRRPWSPPESTSPTRSTRATTTFPTS